VRVLWGVLGGCWRSVVMSRIGGFEGMVEGCESCSIVIKTAHFVV